MTSTFLPLVPLASQGCRGVLIQTSTLHQLLGQPHAVVAQEHNVEAGPWLPDELYSFLNQGLPCLVCGMGLTDPDELHQALRVCEHATEALWLLQQESGSLVGGEAPGKAERQRVRSKERRRPLHG